MGKLARLPANDRAPEAATEVASIARPQTRYYAFLSYSHKDKDIADWLHRELERFRVPRALAGKLTANGVIPRRLTPIFRDQHDLAAAGDLGGEIKSTLAASQFLIVLCSPTAAVSRWTNAEVEWFKHSHPEGCVLAAIASGEPFASELRGREDEECFPPALRQKSDRRGRPTGRRAEPLAADLRAEGEARRLGFLKLVAGMLGVGLDELVQRETTRRHRRLAWLAAASLAGMTVTSTLAVTAMHARDSAREQRRQAEGLVAFMVGDLRDKLEPIGKLDVLDGVGSRVLAYYKNQDTSDLSDAALMQRSRALNLMAEVAYDRGNLKQAEQLYHQAMAGTGEALRRSPDDPKRLFDHAQNVFWIGEVARYGGDPDTAAAAYAEYKRLADRLASLQPDNLKYRMEALYGQEDVGISLYNKRRYAEATNEFLGSLDPMEKLASLYPAKLEYQKELGKVLSWLAEARRAQGQFDGAIAARRQQLAVLEGLLNSGAADVDIRQQDVIAHLALGILLSERDGPAAAVTQIRTAVDEADRLIVLEPKNALWKMSAAMARLNLARQLLALGSRDAAAAETAASCRLAGGLTASGAGMARVRSTLTDCHMMMSRLALARGATTEALSAAEQALTSARSEHNEDPMTYRYRLVAANLLLGDVRQRAGDAAGAANAWNAGLEEVPAGVTERPSETDTHVQLLSRLGRGAEARQLAARLKAIGYRRLA